MKIFNIIIILLISIFAITGCANTIGNSKDDPLKLKTKKENIVGYKKFKNEKNEEIVKYAYKTVEIEDKRNEKKEMRTKHSMTFDNGDGTVSTEIISGEPQYYKDVNDKWYQAEYATTTEKEFVKQTSLAWYEKLLGKEALAVDSPFYPDANPESTSVDGFINSSYTASWDTAHDETSAGGSVQDTHPSNTNQIGAYYANYIIQRSFDLFDTSAIPDDDIISSATVNYYISSVINGDSSSMVLVQTNPASNTGLIADDYDQCGDAINNPTEGATRLAYASVTTGQYNTMTLNATGLTWINKTGITKLGLRVSRDADDQAPTGDNTLRYYQSEETGTDKDTKLIVTHAPAAPSSVDDTYKRNRPIMLN